MFTFDMWLRRRKKSLAIGIFIVCVLLPIALQIVGQNPSNDNPVAVHLTEAIKRFGVTSLIPRRLTDHVRNAVNLNWKRTFIADAPKVANAKENEPKLREILQKFEGTKSVLMKNETILQSPSVFPQHSRTTDLKDIFISVKTSGRFHKSRVDLLLRTWYTLAQDQTYIFTDLHDAVLTSRTNHHTINTNCSSVHSRDGLCCKMSVEYDYFMQSALKFRWFCHVDDDTYVNIPALLHLLRQHDHVQDWYLGKPSLNYRLEIPDPDYKSKRTSFWFATGGAGFCISRGLALKMVPYTTEGRLRATCDKIRLPDDCTIAFIMYKYLGVELTPVSEFHSHLESLKRISNRTLSKQITLSYSDKAESTNFVQIPGFSLIDDPTRFLSIHCFLFPSSSGCP